MNHDLNYENFLVNRPLWASFEKDQYDIPRLWKTKMSKKKAAESDILNSRNLSTKMNLTSKIIENFAYDYDLEAIWRNPFSKLAKLRKTACVLTPDFSVTPSMGKAQVIENTFKNRWIGCFYQQESIDIIPTITWADEWTYEICIQGIEIKNPVAVSTIGVSDKNMFLKGYRYFMENIKPEYVICYGKRIPGMYGNIIVYDYEDAFMPKEDVQLRLFPISRLEVIEKEEF